VGFFLKKKMSNNDLVEVGELSNREDVITWVKNTPKCHRCGFYVTLCFSGIKHEHIWSMCSNTDCVLYKCHTFITPGWETEPKKRKIEEEEEEKEK
jgi:hypothetical protein